MTTPSDPRLDALEREVRHMRADLSLCLNYVRAMAQEMGIRHAVTAAERDHAAEVRAADEADTERPPANGEGQT